MYVRDRVYVSRVYARLVYIFRTYTHKHKHTQTFKMSVVLLAQRSQHTRCGSLGPKTAEQYTIHVGKNHHACKSQQRPLDRTRACALCPFAATDAVVVATFERKHFLSTSPSSLSPADDGTAANNPYSFLVPANSAHRRSIHAESTAYTNTLAYMRM